MIESITTHRDPQPQFEAMYIVMSTSQNVDRIIRDFSNGHKQYAAAHLFFVDGTCFLVAKLRGGRPRSTTLAVSMWMLATRHATGAWTCDGLAMARRRGIPPWRVLATTLADIYEQESEGTSRMKRRGGLDGEVGPSGQP